MHIEPLNSQHCLGAHARVCKREPIGFLRKIDTTSLLRRGWPDFDKVEFQLVGVSFYKPEVLNRGLSYPNEICLLTDFAFSRERLSDVTQSETGSSTALPRLPS